MTGESRSIHTIDDGEEFIRTWAEFGFIMPEETTPAWIEAVNTRRYSVLVAKLGKKLVAHGLIRWDGANPREQVFFDIVASNFPNEPPSPAVHSVGVLEDYRRQGHGHAIMDVVESMIVERPEVSNRAVLAVRQTREAAPARKMYESRGYYYLSQDGETVFTNLAGEVGDDGTMSEIEVLSSFMAKELLQQNI